MSGVSNTVATRIRNKLIRKLKREGKCLPGCDTDGKRRKMKDHQRHVPPEMIEKLRGLILEQMPVRRAAAICGIGACTAYRVRDELKAELGDLPKRRLPGRVSKLHSEMLYAQAIPSEQLMRFRQLVREHGEANARRLLRAEMVEAKRNRSFDEQLEALRSGEAKLAPTFRPSRIAPDFTLGGVTGAIL